MNSVTIFSHDGRLLCDHDDPSPARSREAVRAPARRDSEWEPGAPDASSPDDEVRMTPQRSAVATAFLRQRSLPPAQSQRAGSGGASVPLRGQAASKLLTYTPPRLGSTITAHRHFRSGSTYWLGDMGAQNS